MNPMSSRRYTELVDRINASFGTIMKYVRLRIILMEKELEDNNSKVEEKHSDRTDIAHDCGII